MATSWFLKLLTTTVAAVSAAPSKRQTGTVVVDLGYSLHQGTLFNGTNGPSYYRFGNVQYATAKRFEEPRTPATNRTVQKGENDATCANFAPTWNTASDDYLAGEYPDWPTVTAENAGSPPAGAQDDCLYLDMLVPAGVYSGKKAKAPVMLYIHGGGYTAGERAADSPGGYEGAGYMARSNGGVIFISISYRDGLFGWLAGPSYEKNARPNLGLKDQRFALEWVQKYIGRFGGDRDNVMIFGESAGGGSVMHQIIAYGGKRGTPFKHALPQSPWHQPINAQKAEGVYRQVLRTANVSSFEQLRSLDYRTLWTVNAIVVGNSRPFSTFNFGPTVDGDILPDTYTNLINGGAFDRSLNLFVGHNGNEGALFTSPFIKNETAYVNWLRASLPGANATIIDYVAKKLYPPVFDGSQGYTDFYGRLDATVGDFSIVCNAYLLSTQFAAHNGMGSSFAYLFSVPPGYHAADIPYTFYAEGESKNVNATLATTMQKYFYNFARTGSPNGAGLPSVPFFQTSHPQQMDFNITGIRPIKSDNVNRRCEWWARGLYQ